MVNWEASYLEGEKAEKRLLTYIRDYFKKDIKRYDDRYSQYDYYDEDKFQYELKDRSASYSLNSFKEVMITTNKLRDIDLYLIFNFKDYLAYIKYDKKQFKDYKVAPFSRAEMREDEKDHTFIPVKDLTIIQKWKKIPPKCLIEL